MKTNFTGVETLKIAGINCCPDSEGGFKPSGGNEYEVKITGDRQLYSVETLKPETFTFPKLMLSYGEAQELTRIKDTGSVDVQAYVKLSSGEEFSLVGGITKVEATEKEGFEIEMVGKSTLL